MAHSRLEKIGTLYSRISGLIRAGAMKIEDRPMWYDIYAAFPPKYPPRFDRPPPDAPINQIFYPEDVIRAKFYKKLKNMVPAVDMVDANQTLIQKCIQLCLQLQKEKNVTLNEAFDTAINDILVETKIKYKTLDTKSKELKVSNESLEKPPSIVIKDIFKP